MPSDTERARYQYWGGYADLTVKVNAFFFSKMTHPHTVVAKGSRSHEENIPPKDGKRDPLL